MPGWLLPRRTDLAELRRLSGAEWRLALRLVVELPLLQLGVNRRGVHRTARWYAERYTSPGCRPPSPSELAEAARLHRMVDIVGRRNVLRATCVPQSLALWRLLQRRGVCCVVRVGADLPSSGLTAHAWVETGSAAFGDEGHVAFEGFDLMAGHLMAGHARPSEGGSRS